MRRNDAGDALGHDDSGAFEGGDFLRIVGQQADAVQVEVTQDVAGHLVVPQVSFKAEFDVGLHGVEAVVLQFVGAEFVEQADAAAFLVLINDQSTTFGGDQVESEFELGTAIAAQAMKHVAGEAF